MFRARQAIMYAFMAAMLLAAFDPGGARAQGASEIKALNSQVLELHRQGKYAEAATIAQKALSLSERSLGKDHPETLTIVNNLAALYNALGRDRDAEPFYRRAVEGRQRVLGKEHVDTLTSINNLAGWYYGRGRYTDAEPLFRLVMETSERTLGKDHSNTLGSANNLATLYNAMGRYDEAEALHKRSLEANERLRGKDHPSTLLSMDNLAGLYQSQGRYREAEQLFERVLATYERISGKDHPDTLRSVNNLAFLQVAQGRYSEVEPLYKRALEGYERLLGKEHPVALQIVDNLAGLYALQGRHDEAEPLYKRAAGMRERVLGEEHPDTLASVNNLALLYENQRRYTEAEPLLKRVLEASERRRGKDHPRRLTSVNNLAGLYLKQERYSEAEPLYVRAMESRKRMLGEEHPDTLRSVNNLADLYDNQGRYREAEPLLKRSWTVSERVLGPNASGNADSVSNLAGIYHAQGRYAEAEPLLKRVLAAREGSSARIIPIPWGASTISRCSASFSATGRALRNSGGAPPAALPSGRSAVRWITGQAATGKGKSEAEQLGWQFAGLVKTIYRLAPQGAGPDQASVRETFQTAQWALSSDAAQSLAQMSARGAKGDGTLAAIVRERQDLLADWQKRDVRRSALLGLEAAKRDAKAEAENTARLAAIEARLAEIDKRLTAEFPDYAALASPEPLGVEEVQGQLGADEALVLFLDTSDRFSRVAPEETFIWVVTRTAARWFRSDLGTGALAREVQALRCGLDAAQWTGTRLRWTDLRQGRCGSRQAAAVRSCPGAPALQGAVRRGRGPHQGKASPARTLRSADAIAVPGAGDGATVAGRGTSVGRLACPQSRAHRSAGRLFAQGAAPCGAQQPRHETDDRFRQSAARRQSGRSLARCARQGAGPARARKAAMLRQCFASRCRHSLACAA